jgi:hypothetical protein
VKQHEMIEILDVLACDISARPRTAPTFEEVSVYLRTVTREAGAIVIAFDPAGAADVRSLVAAESLCCATMRWDLEENDEALILRVGGSPAQLDALARMLPPA